MGNNYAIETQSLTRRYGRLEAVSALNLKVGTSQITGFLGRNGAGKSTTIRMLLGMTRSSEGGGTVSGRSICEATENREMRRHVAYAPFWR